MKELTLTFVLPEPNGFPVLRVIVWDIDEETKAQSVEDIREGDPRETMNETLKDLHERGFLPDKFRLRK